MGIETKFWKEANSLVSSDGESYVAYLGRFTTLRKRVVGES
jgi:hypothetical protein